jgi:hypothetical protein
MSNDFDPTWKHGHVVIKSGGTALPARYLGPIEHAGHPYAFAVRKWDGGDEELWVISEAGRSPQYGKIINAPAPKRKFVGWVNFYADQSFGSLQETIDEANKRHIAPRIACIRVEFEEGDGL